MFRVNGGLAGWYRSSLDPEACLSDLDRFKAVYDVFRDEKQQAAARHVQLEDAGAGLFQAGPVVDDDDYAEVAVTKLRLRSSLTAMDLYGLDKQLPKEASFGATGRMMACSWTAWRVCLYLLRVRRAQSRP